MSDDLLPIRLCKECAYARNAGRTVKLVCVHPNVNLGNTAYLSSEEAMARSTKLERGLRRGACGTAGALWVPLPIPTLSNRADGQTRPALIDKLDF